MEKKELVFSKGEMVEQFGGKDSPVGGFFISVLLGGGAQGCVWRKC